MSEKNYPSAALLQSVCADDYKRLIETYDRIYDKVNIALAFSGAVLLVILSAFDYTIVKDICKGTNKELFTILESAPKHQKHKKTNVFAPNMV